MLKDSNQILGNTVGGNQNTYFKLGYICITQLSWVNSSRSKKQLFAIHVLKKPGQNTVPITAGGGFIKNSQNMLKNSL